MLDETIGFTGTKPIGFWNKSLGVDYPGVFKALLKATLAAATANAPGVVSAAIDGWFAFKIDDAKRPPEELAWLLIRRALAHAMAKLAIEALKRHDREPDDPDGFVAHLDAALDGVEIPIDYEFVDRPGDHPIVGTLVGPFEAWLRAYGLNQAETHSVTRRLGAYFTLALHREWADYAHDYRILEAKLVEADTPFARANAVERAWIKNTAYLQRLIREPVFDEPFGLHDVYVPLRGYYVEEAPDQTDYNRVRTERDSPERSKIAVDLRAECLRWLKGDDPRDPVRLISGDPGSGKTSFAKEFAAELADTWPQGAGAVRRVLFVPLHRFNFTGDLQLTLRNYLSSAGIVPRDYDPLDAASGTPRLLIFFDGLDEISEQGRPGRDAIQKFAGQVDILARTLNHTQSRVFFILGGRELAVGASSQHFQRPRQILHVLPYRIEAPESYQVDPDSGPAELCDLRQVWWRSYGAAKGKPYDRMPKVIDRPDLEPITSQPLLNYLLAQSLERGKLDFSGQISLNDIYLDLLAAVYERHWGDPDSAPSATAIPRQIPRPGHPAVKSLDWDDFVRVLEEVALLAWHGTGRTVPACAVETACEELRLKDKLDAFKQGTETGAVSLLVSFFFRQAEQVGGEPSFEFTHKSFGEYLAARRLARAIAQVHDQRERNRRDPEDGWTTIQALERWVRVTGWRAIDRDLLGFLSRQIALQPREAVENWRKTLAELFSDQLQRGLPMHHIGLSTFQEMTRQARNAEEALLAAHFSCASMVKTPSGICRRNGLQVHDLLARLGQGQLSPLARLCLGWLHFEGRDDTGVWIKGDFDVLSASGICFPGFEMHASRVGVAHLEGAELEGAHIVATQIETARLEWAHLECARIERTSIERANLERAHLEGAWISASSLEGANLAFAHLMGALIQRTNLSAADFRGADLQGMYIEESNLVGARNLDVAKAREVRSWRGTRIERKWVDHLQLDAEALGLVVVDDLPDEPDLEPNPDLPDDPDR